MNPCRPARRGKVTGTVCSSFTDCRSGCIRSAPTELPCPFAATGLFRVDASIPRYILIYLSICRGVFCTASASLALLSRCSHRPGTFFSAPHCQSLLSCALGLISLLRFSTAVYNIARAGSLSSVGTSRVPFRVVNELHLHEVTTHHTPFIPVACRCTRPRIPHQQRSPSQICLSS